MTDSHAVIVAEMLAWNYEQGNPDSFVVSGWADRIAALEAGVGGVVGEVTRLRELAATCYAGLVAECDLPEPWADVFLAASAGDEFTTDGLLPFKAAAPKASDEREASMIEHGMSGVDFTPKASEADLGDYQHPLETMPKPQADPAPCVICGEDDPHTGTCGSDDPRALCKQQADPAPPAAPDEAMVRDAMRYQWLSKRYDDLTTSQSDRLLDALGLDNNDTTMFSLDAAIDAALTGEKA